MSVPHRLPSSLLLLCALGCAESPRAPRHVVICVVDTLRADSLGAYGRSPSVTPRIDALARESTVFDQAIAASSWTLPSVASLLTGTWPSVHKALGKRTRLTPVSEDVATAAEVFREAGFATAAVTNAAFLSPALGLDRGFDVFDHRHAFNVDIRSAVDSVDRALALLDEERNQRSFLLVHLFDAHLDYDPPESTRPRELREPQPPISMADCEALATGSERPAQADVAWVRSVYDAEVAYVDSAVGRLVDGLRELGVYDDTLLVLLSDHGEEFWEHGGFEHGHTLYDELVRVPLLLKLPSSTPGVVRPRVDAQVRLIDVLPTAFEVFDVAQPDSFLGASLLALALGESYDARLAFSEGTLYGTERFALRGERYKYIVSVDRNGRMREELYDWVTDAAEERDLAPREHELLREQRDRMRAFRIELDARAVLTRPGAPKDLTPEGVRTYEASLDALGYTGRDED